MRNIIITKSDRIVCALSITLLTAVIVQNAVFGQKFEAASEPGTSIAENAEKLDKLFLALNTNQSSRKSGWTRKYVRPHYNGLPTPNFVANSTIANVQRMLAPVGDTATIAGGAGHRANNDTIELAQIELQRLGYEPGPIDGRLGQRTIHALRSFKSDMKLPANSNISSSVLDLLISTTRSSR